EDEPVAAGVDPEQGAFLAAEGGGVSKAGKPGWGEADPRLHEHDEDRRDDDPDRVGGDEEVRVAHLASTASSARPVRLWVTLSTRLVQTRPSPDSLPLRAESMIAPTTACALSSPTLNMSRAFGRNRDPKTPPRH